MDNETNQEPVKSTQEKDKGGRPENCGHCHKPKRPNSKEPKKDDEYCHCGQPTKFTPEIIGKLKDAFAIDANITQACKYAEIHTDTFYEWLKVNPKFSAEITAMREALPLKAKENIALRIHGKPTTGDIGLSKWLIERKESKDSVETIRHELSGNVSSEPFSLEDDEDPEVKDARENLINKRRAARQRRAVEKDTRLKELLTQKTKQHEQNANSESDNQLVDNNRVDHAGDNSEPPVSPADSVDNLA